MTSQTTQWWLSIRFNGQLHFWPLGDVSHEELEARVERAKRAVGFPEGDEWLKTDGQDISMFPEEPHARTLATAQLHKASDLDG